MLILKCIHVTYRLKLAPDQRATAERVLGFHADYCPVALSIGGCIKISTSLEMDDI